MEIIFILIVVGMIAFFVIGSIVLTIASVAAACVVSVAPIFAAGWVFWMLTRKKKTGA